MIWLWLFVLYIILFYIREYRIRKKSPPGPWPIPLFGNLVQLGTASNRPDMALYEVAKRYKGGITRLKFGNKEAVVLSSYESVKEVLQHPNASGRPLIGLLYDRNEGKKLGIIFSEGEFWDKKRTWVFRKLKEFGLLKSNEMVSNTNEVVDIFLSEIDQRIAQGQETFEMEEVFTLSTYKLLWKMLIGRLPTEKDNTTIYKLIEKAFEIFRKGSHGPGIVQTFPIVKYILPEWSGYKAYMEVSSIFRKAAMELLEKAKLKSRVESTKPSENFIAAYAVQMINEPNSKDFNDEDFKILFADLFQAGTDTISSYLEAVVLYLILYPDMQSKVYAEIQNTIPHGRLTDFTDSKRMIYTEAFMAEVHRCARIAPHFVARRVTKDFEYDGFLIQEDCIITVDLLGVFNDSKVFGNDCEKFRPERFIGKDGKLTENYKKVIPFGSGKRICPGLGYAEVVSFCFLINLLKNYELSTVPGKPAPATEMRFGITQRPQPFQILIKKRFG